MTNDRLPVRAISGWETIKFHFSNTIAPVVVSGVLKVMEILSAGTERPDKLERNASYRGKGLTEAGFVLKKGDTPIISVMLVNAKLSQDFSKALYDGGKSGRRPAGVLRRQSDRPGRLTSSCEALYL